MSCEIEVLGKSDSTFESPEYAEYEREFKRYTEENLRTQSDVDFAEELFDDDAALQKKLETLAAWWQESKHVVVYTGAGISTAAGLPDYRGPKGVWTRKLGGEDVDDSIKPEELKPTLAHCVVKGLVDAGHIAAVISTNVDGLHLASGVSKEVLCELHGNAFVEECRNCGMRFYRSFATRTATGLFEHATGRHCESCGGELYDNVVNFGNTFEHVPSMEGEHDRAWVQCMKADLCVVLGSSLSVQTACDLPEECLRTLGEKHQEGRLVIVNRQRTPKDDLASLRIFADCDAVLEFVRCKLLAD